MPVLIWSGGVRGYSTRKVQIFSSKKEGKCVLIHPMPFYTHRKGVIIWPRYVLIDLCPNKGQYNIFKYQNYYVGENTQEGVRIFAIFRKIIQPVFGEWHKQWEVLIIVTQNKNNCVDISHFWNLRAKPTYLRLVVTFDGIKYNRPLTHSHSLNR